MIIGLVLLGIVAALLFFGIAERVFKSFGVAYWLAFVLVGVLIGCAFIPSFNIGVVEINAAGFLAPIAFAILFFVFAARSRETWRAVVTLSAVAALYVSVKLLLKPIASNAVVAAVSGLVCGIAAYAVGKTNLSALCGIFGGFPIGEAAATVVEVFSYGSQPVLGSPTAYDACVFAAVTAVALYEVVAAIKRARLDRARRRKAQAEIAEEFDPDEYKRYFDE